MSENEFKLLQILIQKCPVLDILQKSIISKWTENAETNRLQRLFHILRNESFSQAELIEIVNDERIQAAKKRS